MKLAIKHFMEFSGKTKLVTDEAAFSLRDYPVLKAPDLDLAEEHEELGIAKHVPETWKLDKMAAKRILKNGDEKQKEELWKLGFEMESNFKLQVK